jgi:UDP-2,3-diacylglucosamine pyrophosphatase LpxH
LIVKTIQKYAHVIPNIVRISLKRVEIIFCPGNKNSIIGKTPRKPEDMTELSTNYFTFTKFIDKNRVNVS